MQSLSFKYHYFILRKNKCVIGKYFGTHLKAQRFLNELSNKYVAFIN